MAKTLHFTNYSNDWLPLRGDVKEDCQIVCRWNALFTVKDLWLRINSFRVSVCSTIYVFLSEFTKFAKAINIHKIIQPTIIHHQQMLKLHFWYQYYFYFRFKVI